MDLLAALLPPRCVACGRVGVDLCASCIDGLTPPGVGPIPAGRHVADCRALADYEGAGRLLVQGLKYRNRRSAVRRLGGALASLAAPTVDVVTWIPTTSSRRRLRGFDQAELLARSTARALCAPVRGLLVRQPGPPQTGRSRAERQRGPALWARPLGGERVLIVDDVVTTGATLEAGARALLDQGASRVSAVALARTPLKVAPRQAD